MTENHDIDAADGAMSADPAIVDVLRDLVGDLPGTHYTGCWRYHHACAANYAADVIEEQRDDLRETSRELRDVLDRAHQLRSDLDAAVASRLQLLNLITEWADAEDGPDRWTLSDTRNALRKAVGR